MNEENSPRIVISPYISPKNPAQESVTFFDLEKEDLVSPGKKVLFSSEISKTNTQKIDTLGLNREFESQRSLRERILLSPKSISRNQKEDEIRETCITGNSKEQFPNSITNLVSNYLVRKFINNLKKAAYLRTLPKNAIYLNNDLSYYEQKLDAKSKLWVLLFLLRSLICWREKAKGSSWRKALFRTIHPFGKGRICWDLFVFLNTLFLFFYVPFSIGFDSNIDEYKIIENSGIIIGVLDIIITLNTSHVENGILVHDRVKICSNYLQNNFVLDLMAIFALLSRNDHFAGDTSVIDSRFVIIKMMIYGRAKFFQARYNKINEYFGFHSKLKGILSLLVLLISTLLFSHLFACMFHFIGSFTDLEEKTWLKSYSITDKSMFEQYLISLYWSSVTMMTVGYGDIVPQNTSEMVFTLFSLFIGCIIFGYNINRIGDIFREMHKEDKKMQYNLEKINQFMESKKINSNLQMRVRDYLKFIWRSQREKLNEDLLAIIDTLSVNLKEELYLQGYGNVFKNFRLFSDNFSHHFLSNLIRFLKEQTFMKNEIIFEEEDQEDPSLYFLISGEVELFHSTAKDYPSVTLRKFKERETSFGEYAFFTGKDHIYSVKALKFTKVYSVSRQSFLKVLKEFPADYEKYCELKEKILLYSRIDNLKIRCVVCDQKDHVNSHCKFIHFIPNREQVFLKHMFPQDNTRKAVFHRKVQKYSSRILKSIIEKEIKEIRQLLPEEDPEENFSLEEMSMEERKETEIDPEAKQTEGMMQNNQVQFLKPAKKEPDSLRRLSDSLKVSHENYEKVNQLQDSDGLKIDRMKDFETYFPEGNSGCFLDKYRRIKLWEKKEKNSPSNQKNQPFHKRQRYLYSLTRMDREVEGSFQSPQMLQNCKKVANKGFFSAEKKDWHFWELVHEIKNKKQSKKSKK